MRAITLGVGAAALLVLMGSTGPYGSMAHAQAQSVDTQRPLAVVKRGRCDTDETFALAIHGGAVFWRGDHGPKIAFVQEVLTEARAVLTSGARAIDVVEAENREMGIPGRSTRDHLRDIKDHGFNCVVHAWGFPDEDFWALLAEVGLYWSL